MKYKTTNVLRLAKTVQQKVQKHNLFNESHNLLITFSGGQDSAFCVLVLYLLQNKRGFIWNRKKLLDFSKQYEIERTLITQKSISLTKPCIDFIQRKTDANITKTILYKLSLKEMLMSIKQIDLIKSEPLKKCDNGVKKAYCLSALLVNCYTLLWCNHFWQRESFFTMEHVSKLTFCKEYTTYLFVPVKKVLSEQSARNWRHKAMQRSSSFLRRTMYDYESIELYLNTVFIIMPLLFLCTTKTTAKALFSLPRIEPNNLKNGYLNESLLPCLHAKTLFLHNLNKSKASLPKYVPTKAIKNDFVFAQQVNKTLTKPKVLLQTLINDTVLSQTFVTSLCKTEGFASIQVNKARPEPLCVQGHNKSDRAEAVLFNLIRGTGMNGLSTLRWKHTFPCPPHSNYRFYPKASDFFKEIRSICLDSLLFKSCRQKSFARTSNLNRGHFNKSKAFVRLCKNKVFASKAFEIVDSIEFEEKLFPKNSYVKTFYYQLKYKDKTF